MNLNTGHLRHRGWVELLNTFGNFISENDAMSYVERMLRKSLFVSDIRGDGV